MPPKFQVDWSVIVNTTHTDPAGNTAPSASKALVKAVAESRLHGYTYTVIVDGVGFVYGIPELKLKEGL